VGFCGHPIIARLLGESFNYERMANQHYVPKFHLRCFSGDAKKRSVSVFNLSRRKLIRGASIKHQCSKEKFYDDDCRLESPLAKIEDLSASYFRRIATCEKFDLRGHDRMLVSLFLALQDARTIRSVAAGDALFARLKGLIEPGRIFGERAELYLQMGASIAMFPILADLKFVLLENGTNAEFITSDHPVLRRNGFVLPGGREAPKGLATSGLKILMTLGPARALMGFDRGLYAIDECKDGIVRLGRRSCVDSINSALMADAVENCYCSQNVDERYLQEIYELVEASRSVPLGGSKEYVRGLQPGSYVKRGDAKQDRTSNRVLLHFAQGADRTRLTLKALKRKHGTAYYFYDGSAMGPLRDPAWTKIVEDFRYGFESNDYDTKQFLSFARQHPLFPSVRSWRSELFG